MAERTWDPPTPHRQYCARSPGSNPSFGLSSQSFYFYHFRPFNFWFFFVFCLYRNTVVDSYHDIKGWSPGQTVKYPNWDISPHSDSPNPSWTPTTRTWNSNPSETQSIVKESTQRPTQQALKLRKGEHLVWHPWQTCGLWTSPQYFRTLITNYYIPLIINLSNMKL